VLAGHLPTTAQRSLSTQLASGELVGLVFLADPCSKQTARRRSLI
jgi:hypothetical protein